MTNLIRNIIDYPEFISVIADWYMLYWGKNYPERSKTDWLAHIGRNMDKPPITLIALDITQQFAKPIGTVTLKLNGMTGCATNTLWLSALFVLPEYRGKGIGTALLKEVIKIASKHHENLYLFTRTNGSIYIKLGWVSIKETIYQGTPVSVMSKSLVPHFFRF